MNHPEIIAAIISGIGAITAAVVAGIRMLFKSLEKYLSELKPNGGGSLKDQVNRLEKQHENLENKVDKLYALLLDHFGRSK